MTAVAPEQAPPRGWDRGYHARFVQRVRGLADRARDPEEESRRLHSETRRLALQAEHGIELGEIVWMASQPLDLSAVGSIPEPRVPRHPPPDPRLKPGSLIASLGARRWRIRETQRASLAAYDRSEPRGCVASRGPDGASYRVTDRHGDVVPNVALTAAGALVEFAEPDTEVCVCGHGRQWHYAEPQQGRSCARCDECDGVRLVPAPVEVPGDLSARVVQFGNTVLRVVEELARR